MNILSRTIDHVHITVHDKIHCIIPNQDTLVIRCISTLNKITRRLPYNIIIDLHRDIEWHPDNLLFASSIVSLTIRGHGERYPRILNQENMQSIPPVQFFTLEHLDIKSIPIDIRSGVMHLTVNDCDLSEYEFPYNNSLEQVTLMSCNIDNIETISRLVNVNNLSLRNNRIQDIRPLTGGDYQYIDLEYNDIRDTRCLKTCDKLHLVYLHGNPTDE